ncbi:bZIP transcription factor [Halobaculum sp. MBLA0147]|uniref:DUF7518 family protein n=1 Tax=Halobaculum sp. MBLA0147 TaxID=3079934 RepID=UPI003524CADB
MGNRVEDLERQVAELRATVDGLTEELVETKERLNQLETEEETTVETSPEPSGSSGSRHAEPEGTHAEFVPNHSPDEHAEESDERRSPGVGSDAATESSEPAAQTTDGSKADETGSGDESGDDGDGDDIIVA